MAFFKRRTKEDVKSRTLFSWGKNPKTGKAKKSGTTVTFKDGTKRTLLNPSGKGDKYAAELQMGVKITNDGEFKHGRNGEEISLTAEQRAYRSGFLDALSANAKAYKAKKNKKK